MNLKSVESELMKEASENPVASAVFHLLAMRRRDRSTLNLNGLYTAMRREGFPFSKKEYLNVLYFLSSLNLGRMHVTKRGRVVGLSGIPVNIRALGTTACLGQIVEKKIPPLPTSVPVERRLVNKPEVLLSEPKKLTVLPETKENRVVVFVNKKPVTLHLSEEITADDISFIVKKLYT